MLSVLYYLVDVSADSKCEQMKTSVLDFETL